MANLKISQLTPGNPAQSGDVIPIERSDVNFSITAGSIAALASIPWSSLANPTGNLSLSMGTDTTTFNQTSNTVWLWANTTTATGSTTNASPLLELAANYYTGSASAVDTWTIGSSLAAGTNGASTLTFTHSGSTGSAAVRVPLLDIGGTDAGISRLGAASLAIGNGTAGDASGQLTVQTLYIGTAAGGDGFTIARNTSTGQLVFTNNQGSAGQYGITVGTSVLGTGSTVGSNAILYTGYTSGVTFGTVGSPSSQTSALTLLGGSATTGLCLDGGGGDYYTISRSSSTGFLNFAGTQTGYIGYLFNGGLQIGASDTGISRTAAASLAIGNGTAGNTSGTITAAAVQTAALGLGTTASSPNVYLEWDNTRVATYWNGVTSGIALGKTVFAFYSGTSGATALDSGISRLAGGSLAIGNGTAGNTTGTLALSRINSYGADMQGSVSSAPTGIVATNVVVAVGAATATFTVSSTEGFTVGDTVTLSASGWTSGSGLASTTATVASVTSTTVLVLTYVSGGPWVAGTYTAQTGTLAQTGGTSVSVTYAVAYTSTPTVVVTPTSNAGAFYISASSTTGFTITYATSGTQTFNYIVMGNPS